MVIVCACEGALAEPQGDVVRCTRCPRTYPTKDAMQILKLLRLSAREKDNDGSPANEHVRRSALNKAARKLMALKLRVFDEADLVPEPAPFVPTVVPFYRQPVYSPSWGNTSVTGNIYVTVTTVY